MRVTVEPQPREFIRRQPPTVRQQLRETIHAIEHEEIFPEPLDEELEGFYKVRVENCRLIVQHVAGEAGPFFRVVFIERRSVIYEMFRQIIALE
jgi:mRNA-degrading endonuclease RelE of RelBE toxin-antitoxin system